MSHSHVKNLINLGYIVDESTANLIEELNEDDFFKLVEGLKKENFFVVDSYIINKILSNDVKIIKCFEDVHRFTVQDMVKSLNEKYTALQSILLRRVEFSDLISINKIGNGSASIIGLVKDITEKEGTLTTFMEDLTGEVQVLIPKGLGEKLVIDDVVAVSGDINNKVMRAEKLVYPDVPIRQVNYSVKPVKIAFLDEGKNHGANYLVYREKIVDKIKNKVHTITPPCFFEIEGVKILTLFDFNPLDVLRKRYVRIENSDFIIDPVPDIILTNKDVNTNYKGITIVSLNKSIDLKTREINDI